MTVRFENGRGKFGTTLQCEQAHAWQDNGTNTNLLIPIGGKGYKMFAPETEKEYLDLDELDKVLLCVTDGLDELKQLGIIDCSDIITEKGKMFAKRLIAEGFVMTDNQIEWAMRSLGNMGYL